MNRDKYTDLIPLIAMGEASPAERSAFDQHATTCADCRAELERYREIVARLQPRPGDGPAELETLHMENEILRRLAEDSMRETVLHRRRAPLRMLTRIAAAIVLLALGYFARPSLSRLIGPPQSTARVSESAAVRTDIRRAMNSGYRFSREGLAVIARGAAAAQGLADGDNGRK